MFRLASSIFALAAAVSGPVFAADWGDSPEHIYREGYSMEPYEWSEMGDQTDGIHLETGLRYWYSMGTQSFDALGSTFENNDTSHIVELHLRVDDDATRTYGKAWAGYSAAINGTYSDDFGGDGDITDGKVAYAGADFGWAAIGDGQGSGLSAFAGYQYWNDSPRTTRSNFTTADSADDVSYDPDTGEVFLPFDSVDNNIDVHMLRLGLSGRAKLGDGMFDISGEVAAVPYATVSGVIGGAGFDPETLTPLGNYSFVKSSATEMDGWGYGAMAELMLGVTPIENLTFRLGGRAWYLQGTADNTFSAITLTDPSDSDAGEAPNYDTPPTVSQQNYIETAQPFSLFRYGLLAEVTYRF